MTDWVEATEGLGESIPGERSPWRVQINLQMAPQAAGNLVRVTDPAGQHYYGRADADGWVTLEPASTETHDDP